MESHFPEKSEGSEDIIREKLHSEDKRVLINKILYVYVCVPGSPWDAILYKRSNFTSRTYHGVSRMTNEERKERRSFRSPKLQFPSFDKFWFLRERNRERKRERESILFQQIKTWIIFDNIWWIFLVKSLDKF